MTIINKNMDIRVGSVIRDHLNQELVITRIWEHEKHFDLEIMHKETRARGCLRKIKKTCN